MISNVFSPVIQKFIALLALLIMATAPATVLAQTAASTAAPTNVHALVYSTRAAELFFTPQPGQLTFITHNGVSRGTTDARSLWLENLDPTIEHRFELRTASGGGALSQSNNASAVITLFTGDFTPPVYRVESTNTVAQPNSDEPLANAVTTLQEPEAPIAPVVEPTVQPAFEPVAAIASACNVSSLAELVNCVNSANNFDVINVQTDLSCAGGNCCPAGNALLHLTGVNQLVIEGNGRRLLRSSGQRQCSLLDIVGGSDISVRNWTLDDDLNVQPCQVSERCPRMLHVRNARSVEFDNVTIQNGKGYTIYANQVNGFRFLNSRLINSGVLGLYIGHSNTPFR